MSEPAEGPARTGRAIRRSVALRAKSTLRGAMFPLIAVVVAFVVSGIVVLATGRNPLPVYRGLWSGAGLDYLYGWIPGTGVNMAFAETNLIATLNATIPLILAGLCVAFAFRAGMFNIGGTGQFFAGMVTAFWIADLGRDWNGFVVIVLAFVGAVVASGIYGAIPGYLKAYRGAHEVITTIMLNWIAIYIGQYLFGLSGPLKGPTDNPISVDIADQTKLPVIWGTIQGLHIGIFLALAAAVVYSLVLRRTSFGYQVRATGFNPEAARAGGINVKRTIVLTLATSAIFAGLAGAIEVLGVRYRISTNTFPIEQVGFIGIAVALLGRNTAVGCVLAAFLFGALRSGSQQLQGAFSADLAVPLSDIVQGVIILMVSGDLLVRWVINRRRGGGEGADAAGPPATPATASGAAE